MWHSPSCADEGADISLEHGHGPTVEELRSSRSRVRQQLSSSVKNALAQHCILSCGIDLRSYYRFQTFCACRVAVMVQTKRDKGAWPSARERHWRRKLGHGIRGDHRSRLQNLRVSGFLHALLHRAEGEELLRNISGKEGISRRRCFILSKAVSIMRKRRSSPMASRDFIDGRALGFAGGLGKSH